MDFWRGFRAGAPIWLAAIPYAVAYVVAARSAGLDASEIQFMSLSLSSAAAQIVIVQLSTAPMPIVLLTVLLMHLHYPLYGMALAGQIKMKAPEKALVALPLTDFSFAVTQARKGTLAFLAGIELSVFVAWNFYTGLAILSTTFLPYLASLNLDFVIPLSFFVLLIASIKKPVDILVAIAAIVLTWLAFVFGFAQVAPVIVIVFAPLFGIGIKRWLPC